jgi:hypothetical protein
VNGPKDKKIATRRRRTIDPLSQQGVLARFIGVLMDDDPVTTGLALLTHRGFQERDPTE